MRMDPFRRCVQDLEAINRLLELPHGYDIAFEMFRELQPFLAQLSSLKDRDPTGAVARLFDYAEGVRGRLESAALPSMRVAAVVA